MWINKLFIESANRKEKICLTIDCNGVDINRPGRFRTKAENLLEQVCDLNFLNNDQLLNVFLTKRINPENLTDGINFQIDRAKSKANSEKFDANSLLLNNGSGNDIATKYGNEFGSGYNRFGDGRVIKRDKKTKQ